MFSCPTDAEKCPQGAAAELATATPDVQITRTSSWTRFDIRVATYCKYKIYHDGPMISDTDRFKFNNINIRLA